MSWDTISKEKRAICACGNGFVSCLYYDSSDDWNRHRSWVGDYKICCSFCEKKYHVERMEEHFFELPWKGDGVIEHFYLVPNGKTLNNMVEDSDPIHKGNIKERIEKELVAMFPKSILILCLEDMKKNKVCTRLQQEENSYVVGFYFQAYKSRRISNIIPFLERLIKNYDNFEWTFEKYSQYKLNKNFEILEDKERIKEVLKEAIEINFEYVK